jgi:hypothetical protein
MNSRVDFAARADAPLIDRLRFSSEERQLMIFFLGSSTGDAVLLGMILLLIPKWVFWCPKMQKGPGTI